MRKRKSKRERACVCERARAREQERKRDLLGVGEWREACSVRICCEMKLGDLLTRKFKFPWRRAGLLKPS